MATLDAFAEAKEYRFNKIVLVHSASAAYIELPIKTSCAILGGNNNGKTSLLHTFLLFLLPEVNFNDCASKFGFQSNGVTHSGLDSFNYYFPSPDSYIILEASNPKHTFCVLLHQSREPLGYGRIAVPKPYAEIEHLFWDKRSPANEGTGAPRFEVGFAEVQKTLLGMGGSKQTQRSELREQLYNRVQVGRYDTQYCLVPLGNVTESSIAALKTLLQLSAGLLPKGNGLAKAVASVISSTISSSKDKSEIDFERIQEERAELRGKQDHIEKLRNNQRTWAQLEAARREYFSKKNSVTNELRALFQKALDQQAYHQFTISENGQQLQNIRREIDNLKGEKKKTNDTWHNVSISHKAALEGQKLAKDNVELAQRTIRATIPVIQSSEHQAIIQYLDQFKKECEERLKDLQDIATARLRLQRNIAQKKKISDQITTLDTLVEAGSTSLLSEFDKQAASLIYSVNPNFSAVPTLDDLSVIEACRDFAKALGQNKDELIIGGKVIPNTFFSEYDIKTIRTHQIKQRNLLASEVVKLEEQAITDRQFLQSNESEQAIAREELQQTIKDVNTEIASIYALNENDIKLQTYSEQVETLAKEVEMLNSRRRELDNELQAKSHLHATIQSTGDSSRFAHAKLEASISTLMRNWLLLTDSPFNHSSTPEKATLHDANEIKDEVLELDQIIDREMGNSRKRCTQLLQELIKADIVSGIEDAAFSTDVNSAESNLAYNRLHNEFHSLDMYEQELSDKIKTHNANTSREISLLEQIDAGIKAFASEINQSFSGVHISNLQSVELRVKKHLGFTTLMKDVSLVRTELDSLASDSFYKRLRDFSDTYLQKGRKKGLLDIERIVIGIEYLYGFDGQQETTQQSNGTTVMVNTVLLSILLDKLTAGDLKMRMPVIFDEAAAIDENNLPTLHKVVQCVGLTLLAATPHFQMHIGKTLGHWCYLFERRVTDTEQVGKKCSTIFYDHGEYLRHLSHE